MYQLQRTLIAPACVGSLLIAWHREGVRLAARAGKGSEYASCSVSYLYCKNK
jgi:hypothetical protein